MRDATGQRTIWGTGVALAGAVAAWLVGGGFQAALVALVGGIAAVLVASDPGEATAPPSPEPPAPPPPPPLTEVLDSTVSPMLLVREGTVVLANHAARALLGGHIVGEDARVAIRHPAAAEQLARADLPLPEHPIELVGLGTLDQRWQMRIDRLSDGHRVVHLTDQTADYAAERMRVDFVANASHELRTPLASILGFIETLADEAGEVPEVRARFLRVMDDEARRMQRLVEDLISLSRIEAEKYRLPPTSVDLSGLVAEVCAELRDTAGGRGRDLAAESAADVPPVAGDRAQLSQMLHNLAGNAMKYGRAGTPVRLAVGVDATGMVRVAVSDQGEGIAPEHIPRLTERFYRVDAGRSRAMGGTGLGLAIVKHIVERHRGRLDIVSEPGIGTTVAVTLPPAAEAAVIKL